jgi:hypothetical protein
MSAFGFFDRQLGFYRAAIGGIDPDSPRVTAYVLGARRWLELESWPPRCASAHEFRWHGGGGCSLDLDLDPDNPVKTLADLYESTLPAARGGARSISVPWRRAPTS